MTTTLRAQPTVRERIQRPRIQAHKEVQDPRQPRIQGSTSPRSTTGSKTTRAHPHDRGYMAHARRARDLRGQHTWVPRSESVQTGVQRGIHRGAQRAIHGGVQRGVHRGIRAAVHKAVQPQIHTTTTEEI